MLARSLRTVWLLVLCCVFSLTVLAQDGKPEGSAAAPVASAKKNVNQPKTAASTPSEGGNGENKRDINKEPYNGAVATLFALFALAVVLESALDLLFRWRPFLQHLDGQGVKMPITLAASWMLVSIFDLDLVTTLVRQFFSTAEEAKRLGPFLTAAVVAGGSGGVSRLAQALGMRPPVSAQTVVPRPPPDKAWIAVRLERKQAVGEVHVMVALDDAPPAAVGTVRGNSPAGGPRWPFSDQMRFPSAGGFTLTPGHKYTITVTGRDSQGQPISTPVGQQWGPHGILAGGIVDITLKL
jgi:hypothetical protein